jgi:arylsulfatase A-like enzyme
MRLRRLEAMQKALLLAAASLLVVAGAVLVTRPSRALRDFRRAADDLIARSESLRQRASTFDPDAALRDLGPGSWNGEYFRLDEHLASARIESRSPAVDRRSGQVVAEFDFDGSEAEPCRVVGGANVEGGILEKEFTEGDHVVCQSPSGIPSDTVGSIRFRLKVRESTALDVGWSRLDLTAWEESAQIEIDSTTLQTIPDGEFHVYELDAETSIRSRLPPGSRLRTFFLRFPEGGEGEIELDYIQLLSPRAAYPAPAGVTYFAPAPATFGALLLSRGLPAGVLAPDEPELRQGIYSHTGVGLEYEVSVPREAPKLRFGMSVLEDDPVRFSVNVNDQGRREAVYSNTLSRLSRWVDAEIDLSAWAGKRIGLRLDAESRRGNVAFWSNPALAGRRRAPLNVLLVLEDSERADHLSLYGYERLTSPVKDRFAAGGAVFERAFSQAPKTRPSCPSFMTSLYPSATGVVLGETLPSRYVTLAEVMRNQGFLTASFIQNSNAGPAAGLHQGFEQVFYMDSGAAESYGKPLFDWLQELRDRNFFAYIHVIDPHGVYDPPPDFRGWYEELAPGGTPVERDVVWHDPAWEETPTVEGRRALYDGEIRVNDHYFERLLEELRRLELLRDTLVIFISDHGEHLGEHGQWEHHDPGYVQVLHVPMFMVYPERIGKGVRVAEPVQLLDVMPTILDIAGVEATGLLLQGRSLLPLIEGRESEPRIALSEETTNFHGQDGPEVWASVFFRRWHVLRTRSLGSAAIFDLAEDPQEEAAGRWAPELVEESELLMRKMKETNVGIRRALMAGEPQDVQTSTEEQERLRALGYIR